jgi:pyruvate/2-oxoglutarate dehydrogenase complex dihydrolipoamide acyltransferase (E2) component
MFGQVQDTVKVGSVLIDVETGDSSAPTSSPPKPQPTPAAAPSAPSGGVQQFKLVAGPTYLKSFLQLVEHSTHAQFITMETMDDTHKSEV